jgi:hypothetical protein
VDEETSIENIEKPERVFALVSNNKVFHKWYIEEDESNESIMALIDGLSSGPLIIDITDESNKNINFGTVYDNGQFINPSA